MGARANGKAVGESLAHDSAHLHVNGSAAYTDDIPEPRDLLHVAVGLSSKAHARIQNIDLSEVAGAAGVVAACTAADIQGVNNCGPVIADEQILAADLAEYAGQALFAVAADTVDQARKATRLAHIDYEEWEAMLDPMTAIEKQSFVLPTETLRRGDAKTAV